MSDPSDTDWPDDVTPVEPPGTERELLDTAALIQHGKAIVELQGNYQALWERVLVLERDMDWVRSFLARLRQKMSKSELKSPTKGG